MPSVERPAPAVPMLTIQPSRGWRDLDLRAVWESRDLLYFLVWRDIKLRYKQTLVGAAWALIQPVAVMIVFSIVFGRFARVPTGDLPPAVFYYAALLPWTCFATGLGLMSNALVGNQALVKKVYFPRLILVLAALAPGVMDFALGLVVLCGLLAFYGIAPGLPVLILPALLVVTVLTALAVGVWLAPLNAMYRDVRYVVPLLTQSLMFASPVIYPSSLVPEAWQWLYRLNPMAGVIEGFRWGLTGRGQPPNAVWAGSVAAVILLLVVGVVAFRQIERRLADVI